MLADKRPQIDAPDLDALMIERQDAEIESGVPQATYTCSASTAGLLEAKLF